MASGGQTRVKPFVQSAAKCDREEEDDTLRGRGWIPRGKEKNPTSKLRQRCTYFSGSAIPSCVACAAKEEGGKRSKEGEGEKKGCAHTHIFTRLKGCVARTCPLLLLLRPVLTAVAAIAGVITSSLEIRNSSLCPADLSASTAICGRQWDRHVMKEVHRGATRAARKGESLP